MTLVESPRKEFVLIVDSDCLRGRALAIDLRALGFYTASFGRGEDALQYAAENDLDVIVSYRSLSDMEGVELARRAKTQSFARRVILLNDRADWRLLRETLECGGEKLLSRPFSMGYFLRTLRWTPEASWDSGRGAHRVAPPKCGAHSRGMGT